MRTKHLVLAIAALLAVGVLWFVRAAWRAHRQLVTLDIHEMPLPQVIRKIESQTWQKICAEQTLDDVRITLHVINQPLQSVLDRIGEEAGAHWSTLYAVYGSSEALRALESVLCGDGNLKTAGWTQLAPQLPDTRLKTAVRRRLAPQLPGKEPPVLGQAAPSGTGGPMMTTRAFRRKGGGSIVFSTGANGRTETWSPEELVVESALTPRLAGERGQSATVASAVQTAHKVKGHWTTYYAFTKSVMGVGIAPPPRAGPGDGFPAVGALLQQQYKRFTHLTPEQRVEQARERRDHPRYQFRAYRLPKGK